MGNAVLKKKLLYLTFIGNFVSLRESVINDCVCHMSSAILGEAPSESNQKSFVSK